MIVIAIEVRLTTGRCQEWREKQYRSKILFVTGGHGLLQLGVSGSRNQQS